jgi:hypothetical protein
MSRTGKIGYTLIYNALFLLILPVVRLFARSTGMEDLQLAGLAAVMLAAGVLLLNRGRERQARGWRLLWSDPLCLWRDRLARGFIAGSMIWLNIYLLSLTVDDPRAYPQAWSLINLLALIAFGIAWLLLLTSPSDITHTDSIEA